MVSVTVLPAAAAAIQGGVLHGATVCSSPPPAPPPAPHVEMCVCVSPANLTLACMLATHEIALCCIDFPSPPPPGRRCPLPTPPLPLHSLTHTTHPPTHTRCVAPPWKRQQPAAGQQQWSRNRLVLDDIQVWGRGRGARLEGQEEAHTHQSNCSAFSQKSIIQGMFWTHNSHRRWQAN